MINPSTLTPDVVRQIKKRCEEKCFICGRNMMVPLEKYDDNYPLYWHDNNLHLFLACNKGLISDHKVLIGKDLFKNSDIEYLSIGSIVDKNGLLNRSNTCHYQWRFSTKVITYSPPNTMTEIDLPWVDPNNLDSNIIDKLKKMAILT